MTTHTNQIGPQSKVRYKVWVETGDEVALSEWRIELLRAVGETGSLARAAARLGVPYRTAWEKLKETEHQLGFRLLVSESGGPDGGSSQLTAAGHDLIVRFTRLVAGLPELIEERFRAEFGGSLG
jgi:molybdate transport system regulatory protein